MSARGIVLAIAFAMGLAACSRQQPSPPARADAGASPSADATTRSAAIPPTHTPPPAPSDWTDVATLVPSAVLDLRYATAHNLTGAPLYPVARCLLRPPVARRLADAARRLATRGHRLVLWDCYRPASLQAELWRRVPDPRYVAEPRFDRAGRPIAGSRHSRGAAVDVSLAAADGAARVMPTDHDAFGPDASGARATGEAARHLADLRWAMTAAGFAPLASEWWHFDDPGALAFPLADDPLADDPLADDPLAR